jgi:uncharacterized repeat protein (TIGR03843 family)
MTIVMATATNPTQTLAALRRGQLQLQGQFLNSSNYTFLVEVVYKGKKLTTVYKPAQGERPLWDFPQGTLAGREVAAYMVSEALGWNLVPATIYRSKAPHGAGSLQLFITHDTEYHYFNFSEQDRQRLHSVVVFDLLINNADRKGSHILVDETGSMWLIDHGVCFHQEDKLRTVLWDFAGQPIPQPLLDDIRQFADELEEETKLFRRLRSRLSTKEARAITTRARAIHQIGFFPHPSETRRPYPWPPI